MLKAFSEKLWFKLILCFVLVAIADFLFYQHAIGWTAGLFRFILASCIVLCNVNIVQKLQNKIVYLLLIGLSFALIKDTNPIANNLIVLGLITLVLHEPEKNWLNKALRFNAL